MKHMYMYLQRRRNGEGGCKISHDHEARSIREGSDPPTFSRIIFETSFFFSHIKKIEVSRSTPLLFWEYMYVKNCNEKKEIK